MAGGGLGEVCPCQDRAPAATTLSRGALLVRPCSAAEKKVRWNQAVIATSSELEGDSNDNDDKIEAERLRKPSYGGDTAQVKAAVRSARR